MYLKVNVYTFYERIFEDEGNMTVLLECPFFSVSKISAERLIWNFKKIAFAYFVTKGLNEGSLKILIFTKITAILRKSIFQGELIIVFCNKQKNINQNVISFKIKKI